MKTILSIVFNLSAILSALSLWAWALLGMAYVMKDAGHYFYKRT